MRITMREIREVGICSRGAREAAKRADINWQEFLNDGVELEDLRGKVDQHFFDKLEGQHGKR